VPSSRLSGLEKCGRLVFFFNFLIFTPVSSLLTDYTRLGINAPKLCQYSSALRYGPSTGNHREAIDPPPIIDHRETEACELLLNHFLRHHLSIFFLSIMVIDRL
jgi:hypothetical protein